MCYDSGSLQALLDGEIPGGEKSEMEKHLLECEECRQTLSELAGLQGFVEQELSGYLYAQEEADTDAAWLKLDRLSGRNRKQTSKGVLAMISKYRRAGIAAAVIAALAVSLSFAPVRSAAAQLLSIFRVDKVQTVNVTPADLNKVQQALRQGAGKVAIGNLGKIEVANNGPSGQVSLDQAKKALDFPLQLPTFLPAGYQLEQVHLDSGRTINFTLDTQKTNQVLQALGSDKLLPGELNGNMFTAKLPVVVSAAYNGSGRIVVAEARSPELTAPSDASVTAIRDALLALPFIPDDLRNQLASVNDWQHTLVIPNVKGSTQQVTVNGSQGVFAVPPEGANTKGLAVTSGLLWQKNGVVYTITGSNLSKEQALAIAASMR